MSLPYNRQHCLCPHTHTHTKQSKAFTLILMHYGRAKDAFSLDKKNEQIAKKELNLRKMKFKFN